MRISLLMSLVLAAFAQTLGQDLPTGFHDVHAREIPWTSNPTVPGGQFAILLGNPSQPGPLVVRVRFPPNTIVAPHTHPEARTYTVLAGTWKLGFGDAYDAKKLRSYPAGSLYRLPARVPHFQASGDIETVVQIESIGPSGTDFIKSIR